VVSIFTEKRLEEPVAKEPVAKEPVTDIPIELDNGVLQQPYTYHPL